MIGLLINTVPLRVLIDSTASVRAFLQTVRDRHRALRAAELTPLPDIQRASNLPAKTPLFDTLVVFDDQSLGARMRALGGAMSGRDFAYQGQTNFPLALIAYGDDEMLLRLEYTATRLDAAEADRVLAVFTTLLTALPAKARQSVSCLASQAAHRPVPDVAAAAERYWIDRLNDLEIVEAPYAQRKGTSNALGGYRSLAVRVPSRFVEAVTTGADHGPQTAQDVLCAAFLLYLARAHDRLRFDVGLRSLKALPPADENGCKAPLAAFRFTCEIGSRFGLLAAGVHATRRLIETHGSVSATTAWEILSAQRPIASLKLPIVIDLVGDDRAKSTIDPTIGPAIDPAIDTRCDPATGWVDQLHTDLAPDLIMQPAADGNAMVLHGRVEVLDAEALACIGEQLEACLRSLADDPRACIGDVDILPPAERNRLLHDWNDAGRVFAIAPSLAQAFEQAVAQFPDRVALTHEGRHLSYRELDRRANRVAHALRAQGAGPDRLVGLAMDRSIDLLVAIVGILKSGSAYLPLDPSYPADRVQYMVEHAQAPIVLTQRHLREKLPASKATVLLIEDIGPEDFPDEAPAPTAQSCNLAYVMYTSGSTGRPKGVQITQANVLRLLAATQDWFNFSRTTYGRCSIRMRSTSPSGRSGARCCTGGASSSRLTSRPVHRATSSRCCAASRSRSSIRPHPPSGN